MSLRAALLGVLLVPLVACGTEVEQAPACVRYTACIRALDETSGRETDLDRFDPGGACWGSEAGATACARACTRGLEWEAQRRAAAPPECRP